MQELGVSDIPISEDGMIWWFTLHCAKEPLWRQGVFGYRRHSVTALSLLLGQSGGGMAPKQAPKAAKTRRGIAATTTAALNTLNASQRTPGEAVGSRDGGATASPTLTLSASSPARQKEPPMFKPQLKPQNHKE